MLKMPWVEPMENALVDYDWLVNMVLGLVVVFTLWVLIEGKPKDRASWMVGFISPL